MSEFVPENAVIWFEIPVRDMAKAKSFYETVLSTKLKDDNTGPNPMSVFPTQDAAKGVAGHLYPSDKVGQGGNTVHLMAPEPLEATLERVKSAGGKVVSDPIAIPPGRFAYCEDLDGNSVGFFTRK